MKMGHQALQSTTGSKMLNPSSPSCSAQGNELTSGTIEEAHTGLLIIKDTILISFFSCFSIFLLTVLRNTWLAETLLM